MVTASKLAGGGLELWSSCHRRCHCPRGGFAVASITKQSYGARRKEGHAARPSDVARHRVIEGLAACVEADAAVERFELVAGRSAMLGFLVAVVTEMLVSRPGQGAIFQLLDDPHILGVVGPAALGLVGIAAALGAVSKRSNKLLTEAVFAALTSASASRKLSSGHQRLNTALDRVFDTVLSAEFVRANFASLEMEDFI